MNAKNISQPAKPKFYDVCMMYQFDAQALQEIAEISGVPRSAVDALFLGKAVERAYALIVLTVLSQRTGRAWNLDNVDVNLTREDGGQSEVARLLKQIGEEYEAAYNGLHGLAQGTAQHAFITTRMENMGRIHERLQDLVGEQAMPLIIQGLDQLDPAIHDEHCRNPTEK